MKQQYFLTYFLRECNFQGTQLQTRASESYFVKHHCWHETWPEAWGQLERADAEVGQRVPLSEKQDAPVSTTQSWEALPRAWKGKTGGSV